MFDYENKYTRLKFDVPAERVLRVTMENEGKLNATDAKMHGELGEVWLDINKDPDVSVVILTGAGKAFSAGGDFAMIDEMMNDHDARLRVWREAKDVVYNVINCSRPVIAAMRGPAVGAGLAAAMVADITIASKKARIIDGHTRLGVAAGDHSAIVWPLLAGMAKAKYYLLTCEPLSGEEAERIGLVSLCVEDEELESKSIEIATKLANGPQTAIRHTKLALNNWLKMAGPTFDASMALEWLAWDGPEVKEGLASLKEKRDPQFPKTSPV